MTEHKHTEACFVNPETSKAAHTETQNVPEGSEKADATNTANEIKPESREAGEPAPETVPGTAGEAADIAGSAAEETPDNTGSTVGETPEITGNADGEGSETAGSAVEETPVLPELKWKKLLTKDCGLWVLTPENTWVRVDKNTALTPASNLMVRFAYELPQGSLSAENAELVCALPKAIHINKEIADRTNRKENHMNQVISGTRLPDEVLQEGQEEYLAGSYALEKNKETEKWELHLTWNDWTVQANADAAQSGWLMFYVTGADLKTDAQGAGRVRFTKKNADGLLTKMAMPDSLTRWAHLLTLTRSGLARTAKAL